MYKNCSLIAYIMLLFEIILCFPLDVGALQDVELSKLESTEEAEKSEVNCSCLMISFYV